MSRPGTARGTSVTPAISATMRAGVQTASRSASPHGTPDLGHEVAQTVGQVTAGPGQQLGAHVGQSPVRADVDLPPTALV